ncbi:LOW QUALITY PROTEIN: E3 ubiquitin-protein ligase TRIM11-like [Myotis daubentonii]|uniref:LOW QUALITY PROTEIN: E3 ubiquitin-protein ligase TRIM11-like n=1 Tax=Myotis daubentonii TaxID=98922 RepID=UPI0028735F8D|nr:LOW QUALITY PROTEIN: E3 ubiquitin-protein ligase TRIM11-like [Myotis daubentonii]
MASAAASKKMQEEATCSICLHLMAEPVSISCGHSYCQACLLRFMGPPSSTRRQQHRETFSCPQCRAPFQRGSLRPNKQLGSLIAALQEQEQQQEREQQQEQQQEQELPCEEHGERLHLFCEDDGQLICWRCERHGQHKGHNTALVEDASPGYREKLQEAVRRLKKLEEKCTNQKAFMAKQIAQWEEKIEAQRQKIQAEFQNLRSFLREEERSYLWRLESEEQRTLQRLRDSEADLGQQSRQLESHIRELEERCQGSAQKVLQDVKGALSRSQAVRLETPEALSLEIETECEVLEVCFELRNRLKIRQGPCEDELPLSVFVWDFLDHLTEQPGSCETDMEQFAETLSGRVTTDEALQELVDLIYQQATSVPRFRSGGARLCGYLSRHLTIRSQRGSFYDVLLQRCQADYEPRGQAAKGDEAARKRFHELVLFLGELYLPLEIEGAHGQAQTEFLRGLLDALLSHPVDDNLICAVKFLKLTGPALEDAWKAQGRTDMDEVIQTIENVALEAPCSVDVRLMLLTLIKLRSSDWGRGPVTSASREAAPENDPDCFVTEPPLGPADGAPLPAADPDDQDSIRSDLRAGGGGRGEDVCDAFNNKDLLKTKKSRNRFGSVDRVSACGLKGPRFDSGQGHVPGLRAHP